MFEFLRLQYALQCQRKMRRIQKGDSSEMAVFFKSWATIDALKRYRVAKYKQRRELNHTFQKGVKFFNENQDLAKGACAALCCDWIKNDMKRTTAESRLSHLVGSAYFGSAVELARSINAASGAGRKTQLELIIKQKLHKEPGTYVEEDNFVGFPRLLAHLRDNDGGHLIFMTFRQTVRITSAHVVAAHTNDGVMKFFDPNSGEYRVPLDDELRTFFCALVDQYRTYVFAERTWLFLNEREPVEQLKWHCYSFKERGAARPVPGIAHGADGPTA